MSLWAAHNVNVPMDELQFPLSKGCLLIMTKSQMVKWDTSTVKTGCILSHKFYIKIIEKFEYTVFNEL